MIGILCEDIGYETQLYERPEEARTFWEHLEFVRETHRE